MSEEKQPSNDLLMMRGVIASMEKETQDKILAIAEKLRALIVEGGEHGVFALALLAMEVS